MGSRVTLSCFRNPSLITFDTKPATAVVGIRSSCAEKVCITVVSVEYSLHAAKYDLQVY